MVTVEKEVIYQATIERIIEGYLSRLTNRYPNGCSVRLGISDNQIVAEITPDDYYYNNLVKKSMGL